jgi:hypothetical protein
MTTAVETLRAAREVLADESHWMRGDYTDFEGRYCLLGACGWSESGPPLTDEYVKLYRALEQAAGIGPVKFNDSPDTSHDLLLRVMDEALASLTERES